MSILNIYLGKDKSVKESRAEHSLLVKRLNASTKELKETTDAGEKKALQNEIYSLMKKHAGLVMDEYMR